ncbi:MAG: AroM family protein [Streptosporangiaceae bacterium]|jgi:protein AroM
MTEAIVGAVTAGQSPRDDVLPEMAELLPRGTRFVERGALDGVSASELGRLAPVAEETVVVTRLRDGREVALAEARLLPLLQRAVDEVAELGATVVAPLCTGSLPGLRSPRPLVFPGPVVRHLVLALAKDCRLGVIVPAADQVAGAESDWAAVTGTRRVLAASPYGPGQPLARAAAELVDWHPDLVVLDCLGFGRSAQRVIRETGGVPAILPRIALAGAIAAML